MGESFWLAQTAGNQCKTCGNTFCLPAAARFDRERVRVIPRITTMGRPSFLKITRRLEGIIPNLVVLVFGIRVAIRHTFR